MMCEGDQCKTGSRGARAGLKFTV
ncbi:rCG36233 [Rattus norvegicus]|uniref:RCG36233 n=1 Tax=Rattus norvegicus TaxID=10116 RepID=A6IQB5_RAT|nr:rCG36233 [Rattus norvegicus]